VKNIRWFICCQVAYATAVAAFWALIRTIAVLRWGTEETNAVFNLPRGTIAVPTESGVVCFRPLQFALLGFAIAAFFGAFAIVSWILRQSKRTKEQPTMMLAKRYASWNAVLNNEKSGRRSPSYPMKKVGLILVCLLPCFLYADDPFPVFRFDTANHSLFIRWQCKENQEWVSSFLRRRYNNTLRERIPFQLLG
jgi:hypothetical protein